MSKINKLREDRKELRKDLHRIAYDAQSTIDLYNNREIPDIKFSDLDNFPLNETTWVNDGVKVFKEFSNERKIVFKSLFKTNGSIEVHKHSDCLEDIYVREGTLYEAITQRTFYKGDILKISADVKHQLIGLEETTLDVTVIKL